MTSSTRLTLYIPNDITNLNQSFPDSKYTQKPHDLDSRLGRRNILLVDTMTVVVCVYLLFDLVDVDVCDVGVGAVEDTANFFEGGTLGLDVDKVDEEELEEIPELLLPLA